jgi:hypothetical protein
MEIEWNFYTPFSHFLVSKNKYLRKYNEVIKSYWRKTFLGSLGVQKLSQGGSQKAQKSKAKKAEASCMNCLD